MRTSIVAPSVWHRPGRSAIASHRLNTLKRRLQPEIQPVGHEAENWFDSVFDRVDRRQLQYHRKTAQNLKKTLVYNSGISPLGLLRSCMDFALNDKTKLGGVFSCMREKFQVKGGRNVLARVQRVNNFRNTLIAHQEEELTDLALAKKELLVWVDTLAMLAQLP